MIDRSCLCVVRDVSEEEKNNELVFVFLVFFSFFCHRFSP